MSIIITGASGQLGRGIVDGLLERVPANQLILTTRTPDALGEYAQAGADVRHADFDEPATLAAAFAGGERLLLMSTDSLLERGAQQRAAIEAARAAGLSFVAYTSFIRPDLTPDGLPSAHKLSEAALRESDMEWCFLRSSSFADLEAGNLEVARRTGRLVTNHGAGKVGLVARADCAAAAAAVMSGGEHAEQIYDLTGPQALDASDRAALFAELLGQDVELVPFDDPDLEPNLARLNEIGRFATFAEDEVAGAQLAVQEGMPPMAARMFASFGSFIREGWLDRITPTVQDLTGRPAQTLHEVLERYLTRSS